MLRKAITYPSGYRLHPSSRAKRHPIYETPGIDFIPHPIAFDSSSSQKIPTSGNAVLWRFRAEWQSISREDAQGWISRAERERIRHYPNSALAKRYLVGRAAVRRVLSGMLGCPPGAIELADGTDGQPHVLRPSPRTRICIHVAYAGIWVIIAVGAVDVGIGAVVPVPGGTIAQTPRFEPGTIQATLPEHLFPELQVQAQQQARHASLFSLAVNGSLDPEPVVAAQYGAASIVNTSTSQRCHILDLPMPGKIAAAVALAQLVTRVDAFGWIKN